MNRFLIGLGLLFLMVGFLWPYLGKVGTFLWDLPGNFSFRRGHFSFYFPLTLCLLASILLTLLFSVFRK